MSFIERFNKGSLSLSLSLSLCSMAERYIRADIDRLRDLPQLPHHAKAERYVCMYGERERERERERGGGEESIGMVWSPLGLLGLLGQGHTYLNHGFEASIDLEGVENTFQPRSHPCKTHH